MKSFSVILLIFVVFNMQILAGPASAESKVRIGVMNMEPFGDAANRANEATEKLISLIKEVGFYEVYDQNLIEKSLDMVKKSIPGHCRDPRCVLDVGISIGMDRMLFGTIDIRDKKCGITLTLIDMLMRQTVETVSLEGAPGVSQDEMIKVAVARIHGQSVKEPQMTRYHGPEVHNEKQFLVSTAGLIGAGLIWGIANYAAENSSAHSVQADYPSSREELSGIAASADQIPLFGRPAALGNAYVAASDDAYGVLYNPAGMAWIAQAQAALAYQYRFGSLDHLAASYVNKATREIGFGQALLYSADREEKIYTEIYFVTAAAYKFTQLPWSLRPFSLGVNLKLVSNRIKGIMEDSPSGSSFGAGIDLGFLWELSENIRYGLLFRDVPVINKWKNVSTGNSYFEPNATTFHMGGMFQAGYTTFLIAEGQLPLYSDQPWKMSGGIEQELWRFLLFRAGMQKEIQENMDSPWKITGGFGLKMSGIRLDGSYEYNTLRLFDVMNVSLAVGF